jgi:hypothetical protein
MSGQEDDRHILSLHRSPFLEFKAIQARKRDIQDEAAWSQGARTGQEFLGRSESLNLQTFVADQVLQRFSDGNVVINNEDDRASWPQNTPKLSSNVIHSEVQD